MSEQRRYDFCVIGVGSAGIAVRVVRHPFDDIGKALVSDGTIVDAPSSVPMRSI
jgi:hypothetical protein